MCYPSPRSSCPFILLLNSTYITMITLLGALFGSELIILRFLLVGGRVNQKHHVELGLEPWDSSMSSEMVVIFTDRVFFVCSSMSRARKGLHHPRLNHSFRLIPNTMVNTLPSRSYSHVLGLLGHLRVLFLSFCLVRVLREMDAEAGCSISGMTHVSGSVRSHHVTHRVPRIVPNRCNLV